MLINPRLLKVEWVKPGNYNYNFVPPNAVRAVADAQQYIGRVQKRFEEVHVIGKIFPEPARRYLEDLDYFTAVKGSLEFLTVQKIWAKPHFIFYLFICKCRSDGLKMDRLQIKSINFNFKYWLSVPVLQHSWGNKGEAQWSVQREK